MIFLSLFRKEKKNLFQVAFSAYLVQFGDFVRALNRALGHWASNGTVPGTGTGQIRAGNTLTRDDDFYHGSIAWGCGVENALARDKQTDTRNEQTDRLFSPARK